MELLHEVESYWSKRTGGYTDVIQKELHNSQKDAWLRVLTQKFPLVDKSEIKILDVGTGPGFFPMILAEAGYQVTAVDYTEAMLEKAKENVRLREQEIGRELMDHIHFQRMDAQNLEFEDESFDVIISRNLTWNLEEPARAYSEWYRVLKFGGKVLNFDANWYNYLYDEEKKAQFEQDRANVKEAGFEDCNLAEDIDHEQDEKIAMQMPLSAAHRPDWDIRVLKSMLFAQVIVDTDIWKTVWDEEECVNNASTPMFLVEAVKASGMEKDRIVSYWTKRSDSFIVQRRRELHDDMSARWLKEIGKFLPEQKKLKILDVGCGAGYFSILLAKEGHEVIGIDLTESMIEQAKVLAAEEEVECEFYVMDAEHPEFGNEEFDVVISRNLTWTLPHADLAYEEWLRMLKKGGVLINTDADYGHEKERAHVALPPLHAHHLIGKDMNVEYEIIKEGLAVSYYRRPDWDVKVLKYAGVSEENITVDTEVGKRIYLKKDELYNPTPIFILAAVK